MQNVINTSTAQDNMDLTERYPVQVDPGSLHQNCQAIIEGVRCISGFPIAEFQIGVGNAAIRITLCESCKNALADEHPDWTFTQLREFK
jgi:hypothetical protein